METKRRFALKQLLSSALGIVGFSFAAGAAEKTEEKEAGNITLFQDVPLFSGHTKLGKMVFIAGKGAHYAGDIKQHTATVLEELEKELKLAGSSMDKVLKVSVFLNDIADYKGMNEVYKGKFGAKPPVRTTVAVAKGGVPGDSLVEMDCIAYI